MATPLAAAGAYANAARLAANPSTALAGLAAGTDKSQTSFTSVLKEAVNALQETGHRSDVQTRNLVAGKSNMVDVVTAVSETEVAIDAVVAVRDKVIAAYEEIMRMPI
jgi:flagellar hook-basal body complex protein FliE